MQDIMTFLNAGWDFVDEILNGTCDFWQISPGDYPRLCYTNGNGPVMPKGLGTLEQPYLIRDARDLGTVWFEPTAHYRLEESVDLAGITWSMAVVPWFDGTFDGNGYAISNLHIQGSGYLGLFGQLGPQAEVSNLGLETVYIEGTGNYRDAVGGLAGGNSGIVTLSYSTGTVKGDSHVGGLIGAHNNRITTSYSAATVVGEEAVGGLVGYHHEGVITACYSTGSVSGEGYVGGLVGSNHGRITTSYSTGMVTGVSNVGGLVGASGLWHITSLSFWDMETSGQSISGGGTGLTTPEMQNINTYLNEGWDFVEEIANGICDYWEISTGEYPRLRNPIMPEGLGTVEQPYLIRDARDLGTVWFEPLAHYRMEASVDLSGSTSSMAVIPWFDGTFDGNGHVISHLTITGVGRIGLFGGLGSRAMISDLGLEAVDVNGTLGYVGGLAGLSSGHIIDSYCVGTVNGGWGTNVGGLTGYSDGKITASHSAATVSGSGTGGLVGRNSGSITLSYSTGTVAGEYGAGGLVYSNNGSITNSYSTGAVTGIEGVGGFVGYNEEPDNTSSSFWDIETSGQTASSGGTGLTTAEMQTATTFLEAGWDFVDEIENGIDNIWWIDEGKDYPRLWLELSISADHPDYDEWLEVGEPICWCFSRQCHGDTDGKPQGKQQYWVSTDDLDVLIAAWNKPFAEIDGENFNGTALICADFDHLPQGKKQYRVSTDDLDILIANWQIADRPDADCP
jgi:hypothetical protein